MTIAERKNKFVKDFMEMNNPNKLRRLESLLYNKVEDNEAVVAYTVQGEPLTKKEYVEKLKAADQSMDLGNVTSVDDLQKESENW